MTAHQSIFHSTYKHSSCTPRHVMWYIQTFILHTKAYHMAHMKHSFCTPKYFINEDFSSEFTMQIWQHEIWLPFMGSKKDIPTKQSFSCSITHHLRYIWRVWLLSPLRCILLVSSSWSRSHIVWIEYNFFALIIWHGLLLLPCLLALLHSTQAIFILLSQHNISTPTLLTSLRLTSRLLSSIQTQLPQKCCF